MPLSYLGALVNYNTTSSSYRVWDPLRHTVYDVAQPSFNEEAALVWWRKPCQVAEEDEEPLVFPDIVNATPADIHFPTEEEDIDSHDPTPPASPALASSAPASLDPRSPALALDGVPSPKASPPASSLAYPSPSFSPLSYESHLRRNNKTNRGVPPLRLAKMMLAATYETGADDPKTCKQAIKQLDADLSREACQTKVESLIENKVFTKVDRPSNKPVITSKWVFKKKKACLARWRSIKHESWQEASCKRKEWMIVRPTHRQSDSRAFASC